MIGSVRGSCQVLSVEEMSATGGVFLEIAERKGPGHPDVLADSIAESVANALARYYLQQFNRGYRFNVDQVTISGGSAVATLGKGRMITPCVVIIAGKVSVPTPRAWKELGGLVVKTARQTLRTVLSAKSNRWVKIVTTLQRYSTRNDAYCVEFPAVVAEDSVVAVGFSPYTPVEQLVLKIGQYLDRYGMVRYPMARDYKLLIRRIRPGPYLATLGVPFIGPKIKNVRQYVKIKEDLKRDLTLLAQRVVHNEVIVVINAADDPQQGRVYVSLTGTSADFDKGVSGRGNAWQGFTAPLRARGTDSIYGKNPFYHTGKIYGVLAPVLARFLYERFHLSNTVLLTSEIGDNISQPASLIIVGGQCGRQRRAEMRVAVERQIGRAFSRPRGATCNRMMNDIIQQATPYV